MKTTICLLLVGVALAQDITDDFYNAREFCKSELSLSTGDLERGQDDPATLPECYVNCVLRRASVVGDEGEFNAEFWRASYSDRGVRAALEEATRICSPSAAEEDFTKLTCEELNKFVGCVRLRTSREAYERIGIFVQPTPGQL